MSERRMQHDNPTDLLYDMMTESAGLNWLRVLTKMCAACDAVDAEWFKPDIKEIHRTVVQACKLVLVYADQEPDTDEAAARCAMRRVDGGVGVTSQLGRLQMEAQEATGSTFAASVIAGGIAAQVQLIAACFDVAMGCPRIVGKYGADIPKITRRVVDDVMDAAKRWADEDPYNPDDHDFRGCSQIMRGLDGDIVRGSEADAALVSSLINGLQQSGEEEEVDPEEEEE